ncbi:collagen-like protein [Paenibacillus arenilitoris]|uniref:Collagen-like protein n=1 Tax=Paenibacillus arenilitoris TaxID=2772299 RepID=A0A927CNN4_9BACL|nr:collagen-like protein [Paenibacillus arenilitoris]MBD2871408.1 collagen-like protein [Paenibacillus arenilitoris]
MILETIRRDEELQKKGADHCRNDLQVVAPRGRQGPAGARGRRGPSGPQGLPGIPGAGLLTFYNFVQIPNPMTAGGPAIVVLTPPAAPATTGPEVQVSNQFLELRGIAASSRIVLSVTVVWGFSFVTLPAPEVAAGTQRIQFSLFRDVPLTGLRIAQIISAGTVTQINTEGTDTTTVTGTFTSSFSCTDSGLTGGANYYLTAAAGPSTGISTNLITMDPEPIGTFMNINISEVHISGKVIGPNAV